MMLLSLALGAVQFSRTHEGIPVSLQMGRRRLPSILSQKNEMLSGVRIGFGDYDSEGV